MNKLLAWCIFAIFCCAVAGCHTLQKGGQGAAEGAKQDANETYQNLKGADNWMKKNLW
jgi:hypothetical protein